MDLFTQLDSYLCDIVCSCCLSSDRNMINVKNYEYRNSFEEITGLKTFNIENIDKRICWECCALLEKAILLRNRAVNSQKLLQQYSNIGNVKSKQCTWEKLSKYTLSNLVKTKPQTYDNVEPIVKTNAFLNTLHSVKLESNCDLVKFESNEEIDDTALDVELGLHRKKIDMKFESVGLEYEEIDVPELLDEDFNISEDILPLNEVKKKSKNKKTLFEVDPKTIAFRTDLFEGKIRAIELTEEDILKERIEEGSTEKYLQFPYKCENCIVGFNHEMKFRNHILKHDTSSGDHKCEICKSYFSSPSALRTHASGHYVRYECTQCTRRMISKKSIMLHYEQEHTDAGGEEFVCEDCGHVSRNRRRHQYHVKSHRGRVFCDICARSFRDKNSLSSHMIYHMGKKELRCPLCPMQFYYRTQQTEHVRTRHSGSVEAARVADQDAASYYCAECRVHFKTKVGLRTHMRYTIKHAGPDKPRFSCTHCPKEFLSKPKLVAHIGIIHFNKTDFNCPICHKSFSRQAYVRKHVASVHEGCKKPRNKICDVCGKGFTCRQVLEGHMRTHTGERPYKCASCSSTFTHSAALYLHHRLVHLKLKRNVNSKSKQCQQNKQY